MESNAALIRYDAARVALAECARIDDAADIRDKAAALAAYARQRDDKDMECWVQEIHLRACVRIGELMRELNTVDPAAQSMESAVDRQCKQMHSRKMMLSPMPASRRNTFYIFSLSNRCHHQHFCNLSRHDSWRSQDRPA